MNSSSSGKFKFSKKNPSNKNIKRKKQNSSPSFFELQRQQICDLAARIIHEDDIRDYHKAKLRACESLHLKSNTFLPTNEEIELALQNRITLFKSKKPSQSRDSKHLIAIDMLEILTEYQPRLTGGLVNGIYLSNQPIEIHAFTNSIETITEELNWRGISNFVVEKRYRYMNSEYSNVPLIICRLDDIDIEVSIFKEKELHRVPICPTNGKVYKRLSIKQLEAERN